MEVTKNQIAVFATIIVSIIYIFFGNMYMMNNFTLPGETTELVMYQAKILEITDTVETEASIANEVRTGHTIYFSAEITNSDKKGDIVNGYQEMSPFYDIQPIEISVGDKVFISNDPNMGLLDDSQYVMLEYVRLDFIYILAAIFFACLVFFGRKKGLLTIISLAFTCGSIFLVFIPSILAGQNIYLWSIITCMYIIAMTLLIANGWNFKSLSAGIGCIGGILVAGVLAIFSQNILKITGMIDEESVFLQQLNTENPIDMKAIVFAAILIGAIGAIMDVAISIASSLNEIKMTSKDATFKELYKSGITIGRDIMGTMTNTLILAYIGGALSTVLLIIANSSSLTFMMNIEMITIELLQSILGSFGILLTLPLTSLISALLYTKRMK